jgi:glycosyltransferase involved in cell wall biosynthesis
MSLPFIPTVELDLDAARPFELSVSRRSPDWGLSGPRKHVHLAREALRDLLAARRRDALVLFTAGLEAFVVATLRPVVAPRLRLVVVDPLVPQDSPVVRVWGRVLRSVHRFLVIRSSDVAMIATRFGVATDRIQFVGFPSPVPLLTAPTGDDGYVYSAGWAHRDWPVLVSALARVDWPALLAAGPDVVVGPPLADRVRVVAMPTPEQGRRLMARASVVALPLQDTDLPSGPLVLLDALALGKPVVVTDVGGSRDYVRDGVTALLVPPGDADALARALLRLQSDASLRRRLGEAARAWSARRAGNGEFTAAIIAAVEQVVAAERVSERATRRRRRPEAR